MRLVKTKYSVRVRRSVLSSQLYTGDGKFFGHAGAGGVFFAQDTGRVLLSKRSGAVNEPGTWGTWGGAVDRWESVEEAVRREIDEETSYRGQYRLKHIWTYSEGDFRYFNFLIIVPREFEPRHSWETSDHAWVSLNALPSPLHYGMRALLPHLLKAVG